METLVNQQFRNQINYDTQQINYVSEGYSYVLNMSKEDAGNPTTISSFTTAKKNAPIDMIIESISCIAFIDNPNNPNNNDCIPTTDYKVNIRDSLSQENWIFTSGGALGQGTTVPINLLFGPYPTQLASPRPLYQNTSIEFDIQPGANPIVEFKLSFFGRRIDTMPAWERQQICGDPRTSGAYWVYFDPVEIRRADNPQNPCGKGENVNQFLRIPTLPFDILVTSWSGFCTETTTSAAPIARAWYEFRLTDMNNQKLMSEGFTPSTLLGGSTMNSSVIPPAVSPPLDLNQVLEYVPRSTPLNNAWIIRQQSSVGLEVRSRYSPLDSDSFPTQAAQLMFCGMRVPTSEIAAGYPYYNRNDGSLRCPPGGEGIPPGYPMGPTNQYVGYNGNGEPLPAPPNQNQQNLGNFPPPANLPAQANQRARGVYMDKNPGNWPQSMPYPAPVLNQHRSVTVRNPMQEGGRVVMPNRNGGTGWGQPGGPMDNRGSRFRNEGTKR